LDPGQTCRRDRARIVVLTPADPDLCRSRGLIETDGAVACEFQAGDQGVGLGGAAAQRPA
jgi:hypothetical protein